MFTLVVCVVLVALAFEFINGFHDTANAIATSVATRVLSPGQAVSMAAVREAARRANIPADLIIEVSELRPEAFL